MRQELYRKLVIHKISFVYLSANRLERFRFDVEAERLRQNEKFQFTRLPKACSSIQM